MKKQKLIFICLILNLYAQAQTDIAFTFNATDIGRDVSFSLRKNIDRHSFEVGLNYFIKRDIFSNQNYLYRKAYYPGSFSEHFGLNISWQYSFRSKNKALRPMIFYRIHFFDSQVASITYTPYTLDNNGVPLYIYSQVYYKKTSTIGNHFGLGIMYKVHKNLYLYEKAGYGVSVFFDQDPRILIDPITWQFSELLTTGIIYRF